MFQCDMMQVVKINLTPLLAVISIGFYSRSQDYRKRLLSFVMSVRPHGKTLLPQDGFS